MNDPSLLNILEKYNVEIFIQWNVPPTHPKYGQKELLEQYLENIVIPSIRTKSGKFVSLNYKKLIEKYSQQLGGAHKDLNPEEDIQEVKDMGADKLAFKTITERVLEVGYECINQIRMIPDFKINYTFPSTQSPKISDYVRILVNKKKLLNRILKIDFQILDRYIIGKDCEMKIFDPNKKIMAHYVQKIPNTSILTLPLDKKDENGTTTTSFSEHGKYSIILSSKGMGSDEIFFNL